MKLTRRRFLQSSAAATGLSLTSLSAQAFTSHAVSDYKALVCVFLHGGNDAYNMVVPTSAAEYATYHAARPALALKDGEILPLPIQSENQVALGLHHAMADLMPYFEQGKASVLLNTGQLLAPTTRTALQAGLVQPPDFLMSHNTQSDMWQTGATNLQNRYGWAGRMIDMMGIKANLSPLIALNEQRRLTTAEHQFQTIVSAGGVDAYAGWSDDVRLDEYFSHFTDGEYDNQYVKHYAQLMAKSVEDNTALQNILQKYPSTGAYPNSKLGDQLAMVSRLIHARQDLVHQRQVFFVGIGGFDTHVSQKDTHIKLLTEVAQALAAFQLDLNQNGLSDQVTSFTMSDFGRRVMANSSGTDHGWAGHQLVLGGAVKGHQAYGIWPDLSPESEYDFNSGRMIPSIASDQVHASLCQWFGLSMADIYTLFPNLIHFERPVIDFI